MVGFIIISFFQNVSCQYWRKFLCFLLQGNSQIPFLSLIIRKQENLNYLYNHNIYQMLKIISLQEILGNDTIMTL